MKYKADKIKFLIHMKFVIFLVIVITYLNNKLPNGSMLYTFFTFAKIS